MALVKTNGIVIKDQDYKENDKLLWIFSEKLGKITVVAKGAKKNNNKLFSSALPLCFGEYILFKGKGIPNISEARVINSFRGCLEDLEKLTYTTYLCELIDISMVEEEPNYELFKEFITSLYLLSSGALDHELLVRSFELKLLKSTGYGLDLNKCCVCKRNIAYCDYISLSQGGGVCFNCEKKYGIEVSSETYNILRYLNQYPVQSIYKLRLNKVIKKELQDIMINIIYNVYQRKPKSLEMLRLIKDGE
ncbi:DNA repair protein RecO [Clostridium frigidicarnis]|uniref:DNA repair protein RecO n=1 Tax=Clostridium frigidicarnis TaxID=84698 RepID=UPI000B7F4EDD|nr:DNA repair protein RecO [Clostridium frigidicarnis]